MKKTQHVYGDGNGDSIIEATNVDGYPIHQFAYQSSSRYDFGWPLQIVSAGNDLWCKGCERKRSNMPVLAIEMITEGCFTYIQNGVKTEVTPGEVFLVRPGCEVVYQYEGEGIGRKLVIQIVGPMVGPMISLSQLNRVDSFHPTNIEWLKERYDLAYRMLHLAKPGYMRESSLLAYDLITAIGRSASQKSLPVVVRQAISLMEHRINSDVSMQDLCEFANTSQPKLHRLFVKHLGEAPINYFINLKMQMAKTSICVPGASIKAIAAELGYDNLQYFSSLFKRRVGMSPRQFQATCEAGEGDESPSKPTPVAFEPSGHD